MQREVSSRKRRADDAPDSEDGADDRGIEDDDDLAVDVAAFAATEATSGDTRDAMKAA